MAEASRKGHKASAAQRALRSRMYGSSDLVTRQVPQDLTTLHVRISASVVALRRDEDVRERLARRCQSFRGVLGTRARGEASVSRREEFPSRITYDEGTARQGMRRGEETARKVEEQNLQCVCRFSSDCMYLTACEPAPE